jgi:hypothetical protein
MFRNKQEIVDFASFILLAFALVFCFGLWLGQNTAGHESDPAPSSTPSVSSTNSGASTHYCAEYVKIKKDFLDWVHCK